MISMLRVLKYRYTFFTFISVGVALLFVGFILYVSDIGNGLSKQFQEMEYKYDSISEVVYQLNNDAKTWHTKMGVEKQDSILLLEKKILDIQEKK